MNRRSLITGLVSFVAAPALVRAESLMPLRGVTMPVFPDEPTISRLDWIRLFEHVLASLDREKYPFRISRMADGRPLATPSGLRVGGAGLIRE